MNWKPIDQAPKDGTPILAIRSVKNVEVLSIPITVFWSSFHPNATGKILGERLQLEVIR